VSGIAGLFNLDGRPADGGLVAAMLGTMPWRGPDGARVLTAGVVSLGHALLAATPESIGEVQPHESADGALSIVFDGRIDNRRELAESFARARVPLSAVSDAAYALAAYRCWAEDAAARLLGDFAFAIWDRDRRRLFCARDAMAQKPFFYHHTPDLFLFASEPQALLAHPSVSRRPNEGMVGEHLSIITSTTETLFADVQRLAPAHRLAASPRGCVIDRYWQIDPARTIRYGSDDEYAEQLRDLLRQAVRDRLRAPTGAGVMLSGGLDSSSVLAMATELRRSGEVLRACDAFSLVDPGGPLDESPAIGDTVAALGCRGHQFIAAAAPAQAFSEQTRRRAGVASSPGAALMTPIRNAARDQGVRVLLSGVGGDEWFNGSVYHAADLFRSGRWLALGPYLRAVSGTEMLTDPRAALKIMTWPLLPRAARKRIKAVIARDRTPPWVDRTFARRIGLADRLYPLQLEPSFPTIAQRTIFRDMTSGLVVRDVEDEERLGAESGVEMRYPFADRRIMEFGLALPEELRWRGGVRKFVLREAMRDALPASVLARQESPNGGSAFMPPLRELAAAGLFRRPCVEDEGWTVPGQVDVFYQRIVARQAAGDPDYTDDVWPMWSIASIELWMREAVRQPAAGREEGRCEMTTRLTSATPQVHCAGASVRT
jgi:asparagine synthase (glutamine-hydrolysing)